MKRIVRVLRKATARFGRPKHCLQGGQGNRLKGSVSGEPRCRLCALITLRAVHSDLEFAAPRDADLPDEGRAYVEHVTTPDPLRERSGGSPTSSELAMACVSAHRAKRTYRSPVRATKHRWQGHRDACRHSVLRAYASFNIYNDLDIVNCHFAILTSLCQELELTESSMPTIFDY